MPLINTVLNMQFYIFYIQGFLLKGFLFSSDFKLNEPFKNLFTQGMVCHETHKDTRKLALP